MKFIYSSYTESEVIMSSNEEVLDHTRAENYLLGTLTDDEAFDLECEVFSDENLSEQLDIVRIQLTEKYLERRLDAAQKNQFENYFLSSPYNSEIFAFQKSLTAEIGERNLIAAENVISTVIADEKKTGFWTQVFEVFSSGNFAVPAFAALLLIVLGGVLFYNSRKTVEIVKTETPTPTPIRTPSENSNISSVQNVNPDNRTNTNQTIKEQNQNKPAETPTPVPKQNVPRQNSPMVATIVLLGTFRDVGSKEKPVVIGRETGNVNLEFQYPKENVDAQFQSYRLILETMSGSKIWEKNLSKERRKSGDNLRENVSPNLLQSGQYRFRLIGVSQDERLETIESDTFFVRRID